MYDLKCVVNCVYVRERVRDHLERELLTPLRAEELYSAIDHVSMIKAPVMRVLNLEALLRVRGIHLSLIMDIYDPAGRVLIIEDMDATSMTAIDTMYSNYQDAVAGGADLIDSEIQSFRKKVNEMFAQSLL